MHCIIVLNAKRAYRPGQYRIRQTIVSFVEIVKLLTFPDRGLGRQVLNHDHARILLVEIFDEYRII